MVDNSGRTPVVIEKAETVRVSIHTDREPEAVWPVLTEPERLACWFGELERPWRVGESARIGFGDGDFFDVTTTELTPPRSIGFEWRFLGLGQVARIGWTLTPLADGGTEVVVSDGDPTRTTAEADQLASGWLDFFSRLTAFLATGEPSRYEWRDEIDGSVDLTGSIAPLEFDTLRRWLPISTDGFQPRWFFVVDDEGPRRFRVSDWHLDGAELTFSVEIPDADRLTGCTVTVGTVPGRAERRRLRFEHAGWRGLGLPGRQSLLLRQRFTMSWTAALRDASRLAA